MCCDLNVWFTAPTLSSIEPYNNRAVEEVAHLNLEYETGTSVCKGNPTILRPSRSSCAWCGQMSVSGCKRLLYRLQREPAACSPARPCILINSKCEFRLLPGSLWQPQQWPHERANWQHSANHSALICCNGKGHGLDKHSPCVSVAGPPTHTSVPRSWRSSLKSKEIPRCIIEQFAPSLIAGNLLH